MKYTLKEVENAYRKYKNHIYYSTGNLFYRQKIAEFECSNKNNIVSSKRDFKLIVERELQELLDWLNEDVLDVKEFEKDISYHAIPKRAFAKNEEEVNSIDNRSKVIVHNTQNEDSYVKRLTYLIDAPVKVHIVSTLWVIQNGLEIQKEYEKYNYGNILSDREDVNSESLRLFKPYFYNYQSWRDTAISVCKNELKKEHNVILLGLDIKDFYNSCRVSELDYSQHSKDARIGKFLFEISKVYYEKLGEYSFDDKLTALPIGLLSSAILANKQLSGFDKSVVKKISPVYYGRYVDDITIVKRVEDSPTSTNEIEKIIDEILLNIIKDRKDEEDSFTIIGGGNFSIQHNKVIKYYFDAAGPITLLEKFEKELRQNSSEFRFLPEIGNNDSDFIDSAYAINYTGSRQKLRNISELSPDKFGVSTFLAKRIFSALTLEDEVNKRVGLEIIAFFRYTRAIEFYSLWEKVYTYFVVTNDIEGLLTIEQSIRAAIVKTSYIGEAEIEFDLQVTLVEISNASMSMALSLNPELYADYRDISVKFLKSNMTRHKYVSLPLFSYLDYKDGRKYSDLTKANYFQYKFPKDATLEEIIRENVFRFCPRYIPFHEVVIFYINFKLLLEGELLSNYLDDCFKLFYKLNYHRNQSNKGEYDIHYEKLKNKYFIQTKVEKGVDVSEIYKVVIPSDKHPKKVNIGIGNIQINDKDVHQSLINRPITNERRKDRLFSIINQTTKEDNVDFLILPEASVPCRWFGLMAEKSKKERLAFVFGLEHLVANGYAFNLIINLLPVEISDYETDAPYVAVIPIVRVKNHYSPSEVREVEAYHHSIPKKNPSLYHLVVWNNIHFTTFNCFELTNILDRSIFRSMIDILFCCEYNADINYFSNLVESSSRDLHCYVVQANSSDYGDSRITQPTRTETKDILKIKGGTNSSVLIGSVNVVALREFQYLGWNLQQLKSNFKATPPGFDRILVARRLGLDTRPKND